MKKLPNKEALLQCFEVANTPESADYLNQQFEKIVVNIKQADKEKILNCVREYTVNVHLQRDSREDPWAGNSTIKSDFQNLQKNLANASLDNLAFNIKGDITIDFAINADSEFLRSFSESGQPMRPDLLNTMDKLFNSCLAENDLLSKNGVIYEATSEGKIKKDSAGNPVKANVDQIKQVIEDNFQKLLEKQGFQVSTRQHNYPEKKPAVSQVETPKVEKSEVVTQESKQAISSEEVAPTTPVGRGRSGA